MKARISLSMAAAAPCSRGAGDGLNSIAAEGVNVKDLTNIYLGSGRFDSSSRFFDAAKGYFWAIDKDLQTKVDEYLQNGWNYKFLGDL